MPCRRGISPSQRFHLRLLSVGNSPLGITANAFADSLGDPLNADLVAGNIGSTTPVPEPSNFMLMGVGLVAVMEAIARRSVEVGKN